VLIPQAAHTDQALLRWFVDQIVDRPIVLIVFGMVFGYVSYFAFRARREIRACNAWVKQGLILRDSRIVGQLQLFLDEAERWSTQGVAVPMTDYSDRMDSIIEGLGDHLHSAVGLFLIVGLAGTFFGMAEFARQASERLQEPGDVLKALSNALGQSFPTGFLGLCLTVIGNPIASYYENRLREAAKDVVNHALRRRTASFQQDQSNSLLEAVRSLPKELAAAIAATHQDLVEQLRPLLQLPDAVRKGNEDALAPLRELYTESRLEWKETVTKLSRQTERMADSVDKIEQPINHLTGKIGDVSGLVSSTEEIVRRALEDTARLSATLEHLQLSVAETAQSVQAAAEEFRAIPESVRTDLAGLHRVLLDAIRSYYETLGLNYVDGVRSLATAAAGEIIDAAKQASSELREAAHSLRIAADTITPELRTAIETGAGRLRAHLQEFDEAFNQHFPQAVHDLRAALATASEQIEIAGKALEGMAGASKLAGEHTQEWKKVDAALREIADALETNCVQLGRSAGIVAAAAEAHGKVPAALDRSVAILKDVLNGVSTRNGTPRKGWLRRLLSKAGGHGA